MENKALLFYGFTRDEAFIVRDAIASTLACEVEMISASGRESSTVETVLAEMSAAHFTDEEIRFLMFLGFEDSDISESIHAFPKISKRPILCTLTENNISWTISALIEHLKEEDCRARGKSCEK
ncbi:MAG: DUF3783 domain-containing protein [Spirochaetota bacterium]